VELADAQFSVNDVAFSGDSGNLIVNAQGLVLDVPADPQSPAPGKRYTLNRWDTGKAQSSDHPFLPATISSGDITAWFDVSYKLTIVGTAAVHPLSVTNDGYYAAAPESSPGADDKGEKVTVTGSCPGGAVPLGVRLQDNNGLPVTVHNNGPTSLNPVTFPMTQPITAIVLCPNTSSRP
jgi:hypothetical protein